MVNKLYIKVKLVCIFYAKGKHYCWIQKVDNEVIGNFWTSFDYYLFSLRYRTKYVKTKNLKTLVG